MNDAYFNSPEFLKLSPARRISITREHEEALDKQKFQAQPHPLNPAAFCGCPEDAWNQLSARAKISLFYEARQKHARSSSEYQAQIRNFAEIAEAEKRERQEKFRAEDERARLEYEVAHRESLIATEEAIVCLHPDDLEAQGRLAQLKAEEAAAQAPKEPEGATVEQLERLRELPPTERITAARELGLVE